VLFFLSADKPLRAKGQTFKGLLCGLLCDTQQQLVNESKLQEYNVFNGSVYTSFRDLSKVKVPETKRYFTWSYVNHFQYHFVRPRFRQKRFFTEYIIFCEQQCQMCTPNRIQKDHIFTGTILCI